MAYTGTFDDRRLLCVGENYDALLELARLGLGFKGLGFRVLSPPLRSSLNPKPLDDSSHEDQRALIRRVGECFAILALQRGRELHVKGSQSATTRRFRGS